MNTERKNPTDNAEMNLNGMKVIARTAQAVYLRIPQAVQITSQFAGMSECKCGHCDGLGTWDTLMVPVNPGPHDYASTVHMPDSSVPGFMECEARRIRKNATQAKG